MRIVRYADAPVHRWKNGGGVTKMIARQPAQGDGYDDDLMWNVSIPEIAASGPFSALGGFDRQFMVLEGDGVEWRCSNAAPRIEFTKRCDRPLELFAFQGEWTTQCTLLGGPVKDLSVLTRRGRYGAHIEILTLGETSAVEKVTTDECVMLVVEGAARVLANGRAETLTRYDAVVDLSAAFASYSLSRHGFAAARVAVIRLTRI